LPERWRKKCELFAWSEGVQIHYRIIDERVAKLCQAVCANIESKSDFYEI
jgi:hypothetical protein